MGTGQSQEVEGGEQGADWVGQDVQAREDPETETDEKKLKNSQKPQEVKTERWRVWKKSQERP